jgi:hypothetical protein
MNELTQYGNEKYKDGTITLSSKQLTWCVDCSSIARCNIRHLSLSQSTILSQQIPAVHAVSMMAMKETLLASWGVCVCTPGKHSTSEPPTPAPCLTLGKAGLTSRAPGWRELQAQLLPLTKWLADRQPETCSQSRSINCNIDQH